MISDELERLQQLRNTGALTEDEFLQAKQQVLNGGLSSGQPFSGQQFASVEASAVNGVTGKVCGMEPKIWNTLMHLSQLLTWTVLGIAAPIIMWVVSKEESRDANRHGLMILNWLLSSLVYGLIGVGLCLTVIFAVIGVPMLVALAALNIIFPIIGAIQASGGKLWKYPLSINFFNTNAV